MSRKRALILGGTKGLGWALAHGADDRKMGSIITGRNDPDITLASSEFRRLDIAKPSDGWSEILARADDPRLTHLFWVAGIFLKKPLVACAPEETEAMVRTHLLGPVEFLRRFHRERLRIGVPYRLTVIASTSSYRMREHESVYCMVKAGKAHFTRQFARELSKDLPGSKTLLVNPGGMRTDFLLDVGVDTSKMMDPFAVSKVIWESIDAQADAFSELNILRTEDGTPSFMYGAQKPETP